jgi:UDP-GlcNAc3NAcA epimerase
LKQVRLVTIVGVRPEFIKAVGLSAAIAERTVTAAGSPVAETIVHTGQHYDDLMSDVFFRQLDLPAPDHQLGVGSGSHGVQTGALLARIDGLLSELQPDLVVVYGDTNTTLAGALAAAKLHIPVAHIEAGLRSFNMAMPEEINRRLTDHISTLLFAPSQLAVENLASEGVKDGVSMTGDIQYDVVRRCKLTGPDAAAVLDRYGLEAGGYAVATVHRAENTDDPVRLGGIFEGLGRVAAGGVPVLVPLHPRTQGLVTGLDLHPGVKIVEPVGFLEMIALAEHAELGLTDSGGLQKELYWVATPCVTLRTETEWRETVDAGWNLVAGTSPDGIAAAAAAMRKPLPAQVPLYGDGHAADRMIDLMVDWHERRMGRDE